jgi:hypothetical protein
MDSISFHRNNLEDSTFGRDGGRSAIVGVGLNDPAKRRGLNKRQGSRPLQPGIRHCPENSYLLIPRCKSPVSLFPGNHIAVALFQALDREYTDDFLHEQRPPNASSHPVAGLLGQLHGYQLSASGEMVSFLFVFRISQELAAVDNGGREVFYLLVEKHVP